MFNKKFIIMIKNVIINEFKKVFRNFLIDEIIQTEVFIIDYYFIYIDVKNVLNFAFIKMKEYYNVHY